MVRGKIQMRKIENPTNRQVTFSKRRNGLMKKAHELSVLCDVEVAVIIFSQRGRLYEFSTNDMKILMERQRKHAKDHRHDTKTNPIEIDQHMQQHLKTESEHLAKKIELLEASKRKLLGRDLDSCSYEELQQIDIQLEQSLRTIRKRKDDLFHENLEKLKERERILLEENAKLRVKNKVGSKPGQEKETQTNYCNQKSHSSEVETGLFIGLPEIRC